MTRIRVPAGCHIQGPSFPPLRPHLAVSLLALAAGFPSALMADHDELPSFGYRELGSNSMPLLTILPDFNRGNFSPDHDAEFYRRLCSRMQKILPERRVN